ncbi:hypothetical protein B0H13DRAFT_1930260 [Mycena leptocephala]|nr:hypothetical protein B0H13DRAFT_1930260 [Mycena leptocephala]
MQTDVKILENQVLINFFGQTMENLQENARIDASIRLHPRLEFHGQRTPHPSIPTHAPAPAARSISSGESTGAKEARATRAVRIRGAKSTASVSKTRRLEQAPPKMHALKRATSNRFKVYSPSGTQQWCGSSWTTPLRAKAQRHDARASASPPSSRYRSSPIPRMQRFPSCRRFDNNKGTDKDAPTHLLSTPAPTGSPSPSPSPLPSHRARPAVVCLLGTRVKDADKAAKNKTRGVRTRPTPCRGDPPLAGQNLTLKLTRPAASTTRRYVDRSTAELARLHDLARRGARSGKPRHPLPREHGRQDRRGVDGARGVRVRPPGGRASTRSTASGSFLAPTASYAGGGVSAAPHARAPAAKGWARSSRRTRDRKDMYKSFSNNKRRCSP